MSSESAESGDSNNSYENKFMSMKFEISVAMIEPKQH